MRGGLDVEGDVDPDRAGAAVEREIDGFLEVVADVFGDEDRLGVLGDGPDDGADVDLLDAELAHAEGLAGGGVEHAVGALDLAGEEEGGSGVEPGAGDAGDGVGAAGAGGDHADAEAVGGLGVAFGADGGGLLVRVADRAEAGLGSEGGVEMHGAAAGDEEDVLDAEVGDELEDVVGELHGVWGYRKWLGIVGPVSGEKQIPPLRYGMTTKDTAITAWIATTPSTSLRVRSR